MAVSISKALWYQWLLGQTTAFVVRWRYIHLSACVPISYGSHSLGQCSRLEMFLWNVNRNEIAKQSQMMQTGWHWATLDIFTYSCGYPQCISCYPLSYYFITIEQCCWVDNVLGAAGKETENLVSMPVIPLHQSSSHLLLLNNSQLQYIQSKLTHWACSLKTTKKCSCFSLVQVWQIIREYFAA